MKKTVLVLIGEAVITAIVYFARSGSNAPEQATQQSTSDESIEVASSNTSTNLHFENLHVNPQLQ
jgi:hypothetical protein